MRETPEAPINDNISRLVECHTLGRFSTKWRQLGYRELQRVNRTFRT